MKRKKLIYDCDPGTDDSVSILIALQSKEADLLAITCESGNFRASESADHALQILEYVGRTEVPVYKGTDHPLVRKLPCDPYSHGEDGLGNHFFPAPTTQVQEQHAALAIIDLVKKYPEQVSLVCSAPLTNVALAFLLDPSIIPLVKKLYHLGGSYGFSRYGFTNATGDNPMSEWNVFVDPEAADIVYSSGVNLVTVGLDVAFNPELVNIEAWAIAELKKIGNPASKYALEIIDYIDRNNTIDDIGLFINGPIDTTLMCAFLDPSMLKTTKIRVKVDTSDNALTTGMTVWDRRDHFAWNDLPVIETAITIDSIAYQKKFIEALRG